MRPPIHQIIILIFEDATSDTPNIIRSSQFFWRFNMSNNDIWNSQIPKLLVTFLNLDVNLMVTAALFLVDNIDLDFFLLFIFHCGGSNSD